MLIAAIVSGASLVVAAIMLALFLYGWKKQGNQR